MVPAPSSRVRPPPPPALTSSSARPVPVMPVPNRGPRDIDLITDPVLKRIIIEKHGEDWKAVVDKSKFGYGDTPYRIVFGNDKAYALKWLNEYASKKQEDYLVRYSNVLQLGLTDQDIKQILGAPSRLLPPSRVPPAPPPPPPPLPPSRVPPAPPPPRGIQISVQDLRGGSLKLDVFYGITIGAVKLLILEKLNSNKAVPPLQISDMRLTVQGRSIPDTEELNLGQVLKEGGLYYHLSKPAPVPPAPPPPPPPSRVPPAPPPPRGIQISVQDLRGGSLKLDVFYGITIGAVKLLILEKLNSNKAVPPLQISDMRLTVQGRSIPDTEELNLGQVLKEGGLYYHLSKPAPVKAGTSVIEEDKHEHDDEDKHRHGM